MKLETKVGAFFIASIAILGLLILRTEKLDLFGKSKKRQYGLEFKQVAGYAGSKRLTLNGKPIEGDRMINKPLRIKEP